MSTATPPASARPGPVRSRRAHAWRWVTVFVVVTIVHGLAAEWIERHRGVPPPVAVHVPVQVALLKPERIEREARPGTPSASKPHPRPTHHKARDPHALHAITPPRPQAQVPAEPPASSPAADNSTNATENTADTAAPTTAASDATANAAQNIGANTAQGNGHTPTAPPAEASHGVKFSVPPSGELQYDTFYNGVRNQPGTIHWTSDSKHYDMVVSVPLPFVGTFSWTSRGHVDAFGLAPDKYIEKRGHRPEDVTVFNRNARQIVFTRTPNSLALPDAAQDRFSMVMQLASLVRGDPGAYQPGVTREFYVADNDSGESWPVTTIGDETVRTDQGYVSARHFMRLPRHDGDKRRIDVWLAPSLGWLPVRLVQTEPNGSEFELLWRGALAAPASNVAGGTVGAPAAEGGANAAAASAVETEPSNASNAAPAAGPAASVPETSSPAAITPQPPASPDTSVEPAQPPASAAVTPGLDTTDKP